MTQEQLSNAENGSSSDESTELSWPDRVEQLLDLAREQDGVQAAQTYLSAMQLIDLKNPGDFQISEVWSYALQQIPGQAAWLWTEGSRSLSQSAELWQQIAAAHQGVMSAVDDDAAQVVGEAWGWVQLFRAGELDAGKERLKPYAEANPEGYTAQMLEALAVAESGNWRKAEMTLDEKLKESGLSAEQLSEEQALRVSDLAMALSSVDRAVEVIRRAQRAQAESAALRSRMAVMYRDTAKWNAYVDVLKDLVARQEQKQAKIDLLHEMIRIYSDEMKLDAMVVKSYEALLEADPGNKGALEALAAAYENARRWPDLVSLLAQQASSASTPAARAEMNLRVAKVYLEKLSRQVDAIKYYEAVLEDAPHETESLTQLKELYEKRREWEKLIDIHRREVEAMTDPVEQATRLKEVADIATSKLRKAPVAIEIWREVLRYAETDLEALNALEGLYEREKAWPELAEICERKAALEDDQAARSKLWQKIGLLYSERINEAEGAIRAWRAVLELDPSHPKAAESLRKLLIETKSWDDLEAFYHERNSAAELVKLLESLANTSKEAEDVIELLFRSATVWQESLETPERAVKALEKIFETDAQNARAAARLVPYYEAASDHEQLVAMLKIQHQKETELEERVQLSLRLASLCELALEDAAQAYTWLRWVMTANAEYTQAYDDFERVGIVVGRAADVVAVYERAIAEPSEGLDVRELRFRMGQVMANELAQVDEALAIFEGILEHEPDNLRALGALESILDRTGRYDELIAVNERRLKLATEPAEEAEILLSGARIHEMQRGDRATAIQFYERVRELVPKDERSLVELHRLYRESGDSEALANVLRARLGLLEEASQGGPLEPEAAIPLWYELGQVAQTDLAEHDEAVECYRKIILAEPEHDEARSALEGLLENGVEGAKIALILEPVYELRADYAALVGVLRVQFDHQRELPEQIDLLIRIGRLHRDQLGQLDEAFQALAQALELAPTRQDVLEELEAITDLLADWPRLVSALEQVAAGIDELTLRTSYDLTLARLYEQQLESPEQAHEYGRAALARGGSDPAVLDTLFELYTRTEAWNDLLDVLERKVEVAAPDVEAQRELKLTIAAVLEEKLAAKDDAIQVYLGVLQDEPSNEASLGSLDRLYAELERWDEAAANFGRRLDLLEDELEKDVVRCKLAKVLERHLGEPERAIEIYRGVLERDASNATALADMEQMLETAELFAAEQIAEILLPLYDALGDWEKRAWVNEMLLRVVDEPSRRCALLHEIASLFEERGQQYEEAFVAYSRALAEDPANEHSLSQLYRYADALDIWAELVGVLQKTTDSITDAILAKETQVRMAKIYREKLDDLAGATAAYEKAADFDPDDESILDALELIYREQSAWEPLTQTLVKKSARSYDPEPKKQLLFQAAMICEEMLQEVERATDLYQEILGIDPDDIDSVDSLERLYTSMQRWNDLMSIYNIKIERAQGGEEQKQLYYVVGALQEQQLDDAFGAIETYRKALDIDPEDAQALEALDRLYLGSEDWMNLLEILEREENVAAEVEAKLALRYRQGDVWHRHLNEGLRAIEVYHSVLEIDAAYQQALDSLEEIIAEGEFAVDAARVLEPVYDALAEWDKLIAVYEVLVSHADDPEERIRLLMTIGRVREEMQAQVEQAFDAYFRALQEDPRRDSTWDTLERIAAAFDFWPTLVERGKALLDESADSDSAIAIASRLATINEQYLEAFMEAVAMWQRVVEIEPTELRAIQALDQLYERQTMWPELAETLQREIELAIETDELIRLRYRLGTINENFLENVPEAINSYNEILLLQPGQEDAIEALVRMFSAGLGQVEIGAILEPFYRETEQWENLVQVGLALIEHFDTATDRYQKLLDLAEIYLGPLANAADGLVIYGRALIERPDDEFALTRLEELAELTQEWGQAVQFHVAALQATDDPVVQRGLLWHIAQAYDQKIGDATQAEEAYRQMLQLDPEAMEAWEALDRIFLGQMRWEDLGEVIKNEITYAQDDSQRIAFYLRLGEVQNEMLGLSDDAIASFRAVIDIDPTQLDALSALERIHESRQEWALLFEVLGQRATVAMDDDERAMLWARMAQIASELLDRRQEAIDLWYQVIDVKGDNLLSLQSLEMLFQLDDRWADMTDVIERQVSLVESGEEQLEAYRKLGRIWAGPLENQERSIEYWRKAMQVNPEDLETLQAIKAIDEAFTDYEDLVDIIRRLVALGALPYEEQLAHFVQLAELLTQILIRPEEAIETWIQVLQLDPSHMQALNALEQLYVDAMRWEDAVAVLEQKAELVPTDEGIRLRMQVAEIWETQVDNPELAGNAYLGVLAMEPLHEEAFARLEALYERTENWDAMQNLFVDRAGALETDNERIAMLRRAAVIAEEKLGSPDVSFVILQSALHINKKDQDIAEDLERLADLTKSWRELVALYEGFIQDVSDPKEALELHNNVARWYFHKLNDAQASWQHFQVVLGIDPNNLNALAALIEIYRRLGNWQEFINLTVRLADLTPEPEDKASRFTEIAVAWEKQLGSVDQAIAAYREVLKVDDVNLNGLRQLERIFQALSRWEELVEVLESQCRALFEPEEVIGIRMRIGQIWETRLENDKNAVVAYKEILKLDEQHRDALEALERLYQKLGQWNDLLKVYEMQLAAAMTGEEQIVLYSKMATVYEEEFSDAENAINCMRQITMVDPSNLMAIQNLERLYRKHEQWLDLIDALNTHIGAVARDSDRIEIYRQLGEVFRDQLEDTYRAIDSFQNLLAISPSDHDGLVALGGLFEQSADWISAIEIYNRLIPVATSTEEGVATHYRVGRIYDEHLADSAQAEERFQTALDIEPSYMPAIDALYTLYERREDYNAMVRILKQKVEYTRELEDRAGLLCGIGQIYDLRLDDQINAVDYYEQTLQLSPTNVNAGRPLAEKFIRERAWARALVLLEMIIQKLSFARDASDLYLLNYKAGLCCQELGQDEKALHFFRASYELNQTHLPTLLGMGRELYHAKDFERAYKMFQTILVQYAHELTGEQLVEIYSDSAKIKRATNELSAARGLLQKVFELDPNHRASLSMMIELSEEQEDWQAVAAYKQMRLQTMSDPNEVFAEWTELAELLRSQLGDTEQALECYKQALFVDPESKFVLIKLLEIYTVSKRWMEALETLKRLCDIESNKDRLAKYHYTMAVICRDELGDEQTSIDFFNLCLDDNVNELRAFEAIDRIITANKDWKALERNYRKMIKRVMDNDEGQFEDTKYLLWYGLAEIYRTRLNEWDSAISAFQQASVLKPHDANMHKILADLYVRREHDDEAIEEFRTLIKMPGEGSFVDRNANHFHSLFKLFLKTKRYDQAWCVCNVMVYLNIATEDERQFNERYVGPALVQASGRIDPDTWKLIYHPENNLRIGSILQVMATHCRELFVYDLRKTWGLRKKDELDQNADLLFCKIYRYMAQVIGVIPTPKLYFNREQPLGMLNGNVDPPGFIVGADMQGRNQRELAFIIARQLSMAVPLHYMAGLRLPSETLRFLVLGAMHASTQPASAPMEPNLEAVVKTIVRMPPPIAVELHKLVKAVIEGRVEVNTSKWLKGVDYTTNRVGLLLCGDLSTAMTAIRNDATPVSKLSTSEKEIDLVQFAISDRFFELRSRLKLSIS